MQFVTFYAKQVLRELSVEKSIQLSKVYLKLLFGKIVSYYEDYEG